MTKSLRKLLLSSLLIFTTAIYADVAPSSLAKAAESLKDPNSATLELENQATVEEIRDFVTTYALIKQYYVKPTKDSSLIKGAISGMVGSIDPHSSYLIGSDLTDLTNTTDGQFVGVGIEFATDKNTNKVLSVIYSSPAYKAGVLSGDVITNVNDESVIDLPLEKLVEKIRGKEDTTIKITVMRNNKSVVFNLTRKKIKIKSVQFALIDNNKYVYVRITTFEKNTSNELAEVLKSIYLRFPGVKGLVLDLRDNPGGLLQSAVGVLSIFLPPDSLVLYMKDRYNNIFNFYTHATWYNIDGTQEKEMKSLPIGVKSLPMVVLINQNSASASEIVSAALQEYHRAKIIGVSSFGKGSVQQVIPLSKTSALKLTTALYYTPNNQSVQAIGVKPDIWVYSEYQDALQSYTFAENRFSRHLDNPVVSTQKKDNASNALTIIKPPKQYPLEQLMQIRKKAVMPVSNWQIIVDPELDFQLKYALKSLP